MINLLITLLNMAHLITVKENPLGDPQNYTKTYPITLEMISRTYYTLLDNIKPLNEYY